MGNVLPLLNRGFEPIIGKEAMVYLAYAVTDEPFRHQGLVSKAYDKFLEEARQEARSEDFQIKGHICEAHEGAEDFLNKKGYRRLYSKEKDGRLIEVPYVQPPLRWNRQTGKAESASVPEHLMISLADGSNSVRGEKLMEYVRGIYDNNSYMWEEAFDEANRDESYNVHERAIRKYANDIESKVKGKEVVMLSHQEREQLQGQGAVFVEHVTTV